MKLTDILSVIGTPNGYLDKTYSIEEFRALNDEVGYDSALKVQELVSYAKAVLEPSIETAIIMGRFHDECDDEKAMMMVATARELDSFGNLSALTYGLDEAFRELDDVIRNRKSLSTLSSIDWLYRKHRY